MAQSQKKTGSRAVRGLQRRRVQQAAGGLPEVHVVLATRWKGELTHRVAWCSTVWVVAVLCWRQAGRATRPTTGRHLRCALHRPPRRLCSFVCWKRYDACYPLLRRAVAGQVDNVWGGDHGDDRVGVDPQRRLLNDAHGPRARSGRGRLRVRRAVVDEADRPTHRG